MYEDEDGAQNAFSEVNIKGFSTNMAAVLYKTVEVSQPQWPGISGQRKVGEGEARVRIDQKRQVKRNAKSCCYSN